MELDDRGRGAIFATTANAFAAYRLPGALASCENPNFDPAAFVAGDPKAYNPLRLSLAGPNSTPLEGLDVQLGHQGRFDTVYITASSEQQNLVAPIVASFLSQVREATFARHRADEADDYFTRPAGAVGPRRGRGNRADARPARDACPVRRPGALDGGLPTGPPDGPGSAGTRPPMRSSPCSAMSWYTPESGTTPR